MVFEQYIPQSFLSNYIEKFIYYKHYQPDHSTQRVVPDGTSYLIFELDRMKRFVIYHDEEEKNEVTEAWISGMHINYITINALPDSEMFVVRFKAYGLYPFLRSPVNDLSGKVVSTENRFENSVIDLRASLLSLKQASEKFRICEEWLTQCFSKAHLPKEEIVAVCQKIKSNPGLEFNSIQNLINDTKMSKKHFTSLFRKYVGLTPKQYQRVLRFNEILNTIQQKKDVEWSQIALSCGYYDQAHFIKEFKHFCGINPAKFISNYQDYPATNFFPLD